jgi:hypothetical protein
MFGRQAQHAAAIEVEGEGDRLVRHGLSLEFLGDGHLLGPGRLHELQPGGRGVEQVADLDPGAVRAGEGGWADRADRPALHK